MSEANDFKPAKWSRGHDFNQARRSYASHTQKSYSSTKKSTKKKPRKEYLEDQVLTTCENPLVIVSDVTGSMRKWPATMFSKLPYFEYEVKQYLGDDVEICFSAIGDYSGKPHTWDEKYYHRRYNTPLRKIGDKYPLQVRPFTKGADLATRMKELILEGGGGGNSTESHEIAATYFANNCLMPNAINPILIFISDAKSNDYVHRDVARNLAGVDFPGTEPVPTKQVMEELKQKFSVYFIRKPYRIPKGNTAAQCDIKTQKQWEGYLGADHIAFLPDPNRVVDCIFGILGEATGRRDYFMEEFDYRQSQDSDYKDKKKTVMGALKSIHIDKTNDIKGKATISLL